MTDPDRAALLDQLLHYVKNELEPGVPPERIAADSPLLEWGVPDSVRTARLLAHIRSEYGLRVPPRSMTGEHFSSVQTITDLIVSLRAAAAPLPVENR